MEFLKAKKLLQFDNILKLLASFCSVEEGKERINAILPDTDYEAVCYMQEETDYAKRLLSQKGMPYFCAPLGIKESLSRLDKGAVLSPAQLLEIAHLLSSADAVKKYAPNAENAGVLADSFSRIITNKALEGDIKEKIISEDAIADDASSTLYSIRKKLRGSNDRIKEALNKIINSPSRMFLQDAIITQRNSRYVIPVKAEYKNSIKGLVHDTSSSGATVFIEPMSVVEINNDIKSLLGEEKKEIERILFELSEASRAFSMEILADYNILAYLSVVFAKAQLSFHLNCVKPDICKERRISLIKARHPMIDKDAVVPISLELGGKYDTLVITGPNTGGKTVTLKTVGLFAMMAQSGMHIPADEGSALCVFKDVLADIGDEQSIEQSLSTFSSHMVNIVKMLERVDGDCLILFDELGAGTDPVEGAALAISILEYVRSKNALCLATTHYPELKSYAFSTDGVENASCEFDIVSLKPTYRLIVGAIGRSNAFLISERLGLDKAIIEKASTFIKSDDLKLEEVIERLERDRVAMEKSRLLSETKLIETKRIYDETLDKRNEILSSAEKELERAQREAKRLVMSAKNMSDSIFSELERLQRQTQKDLLNEDLKKKREEFQRSLRSVEKEIDEKEISASDDEYVLPRPLKAGDSVILASTGSGGTVERVGTSDATVLFGNIRSKVPIDKLRLVTGLNTKSAKKEKKSATASPRSYVKSEIDLRGQTGDDAWFMVDKYLSDAILSGLNSVTLIHGKGTGALRKALWSCLKGDRRVKSFRQGMYGEGDSGVTVVELK